MDQSSEDIKQDIESTRAALDEKLNLLETKARQTIDLNHQISEHPWVALGAAIVAGYTLGTMGGDEGQRWNGQPMVTTDYTQHVGRSPQELPGRSRSDKVLTQFDDEINTLKIAAVAVVTSFLRDSIREYLPAIGQQLKQTVSEGLKGETGKTPSSAPTTSFSAEARERAANYDEIPPVQTQYGSPPPVSTSGSEYYDVYTPRAEKDDQRDINQTKRYRQ